MNQSYKNRLELKTLLIVFLWSLGGYFGLGSVYAVDTTNLWEFRKHVEEGGAVTITAVIRDIKHPPAEYKPKTPGGTVNNCFDLDPNAPARLIFKSGQGESDGTKFTAGYYRGPIYTVRGPGIPFAEPKAAETNYVSIFSKGDRSELIAAVDNGPIYTSTNSGMSWKAITTPGVYEFPLSICIRANGRGLYATATIARTNVIAANWYAVASSSEGNKLFVTANSSEPSPTLNIRYSSAGVTIVWPAEFKGFVLEHNADLTAEGWAIVTNPTEITGKENRVIVPLAIGRDYFRLRRP